MNKCPICHKCFYSRKDFIDHLGEKNFKCDIFEKAFYTIKDFPLNKTSHTATGKKPYSCGMCGKSFLQKIYLIVHKSIHTDDKPYPCLYIWKVFFHSSWEMTYFCELCQKSFHCNSLLSNHNKSVGDLEMVIWVGIWGKMSILMWIMWIITTTLWSTPYHKKNFYFSIFSNIKTDWAGNVKNYFAYICLLHFMELPILFLFIFLI